MISDIISTGGIADIQRFTKLKKQTLRLKSISITHHKIKLHV